MTARHVCGLALVLMGAPRLAFGQLVEDIPPELEGGGAAQPEADPEAEPSPEEQALDADAQQAAQLYFRGRMAYDTTKYDEALGLFEQAYELCSQSEGCHAPALLYNLAQAYWKRGEVNDDVADLRQARTLFKTYDQIQREAEDGYESGEVTNVLAALEAKIEYLELAERAKAQGRAQVGPTAEEMRLQRRLKTTKALHASGTALIVVGTLVGLTGVAAIIARSSTGFMLDQAGGGEAGAGNQNSVEDDRKLRDAYATTGKLAFATLIAAGVTLPVGITLKVTGKVRDKEDGVLQKKVDDKLELRSRPVAAALGRTLLRVEF